jgi:hypothetical protein
VPGAYRNLNMLREELLKKKMLLPTWKWKLAIYCHFLGSFEIFFCGYFVNYELRASPDDACSCTVTTGDLVSSF